MQSTFYTTPGGVERIRRSLVAEVAVRLLRRSPGFSIERAIASLELWEQVQAVLDGRHLKRPKKRTHEFAFGGGLLTCGHCGCALVGETKKGRYVYFHCTGYRRKCAESYTREDVLEQKFTALLKAISFSAEVLA